ncbi:hypothetical protein VPH35_136077 [Triticum aestivum]
MARSMSNMRFKNSRESAPGSVASASLDLVSRTASGRPGTRNGSVGDATLSCGVWRSRDRCTESAKQSVPESAKQPVPVNAYRGMPSSAAAVAAHGRTPSNTTASAGWRRRRSAKSGARRSTAAANGLRVRHEEQRKLRHTQRVRRNEKPNLVAVKFCC